jgi:hypothetical protein
MDLLHNLLNLLFLFGDDLFISNWVFESEIRSDIPLYELVFMYSFTIFCKLSIKSLHAPSLKILCKIPFVEDPNSFFSSCPLIRRYLFQGRCWTCYSPRRLQRTGFFAEASWEELSVIKYQSLKSLPTILLRKLSVFTFG